MTIITARVSHRKGGGGSTGILVILGPQKPVPGSFTCLRGSSPYAVTGPTCHTCTRMISQALTESVQGRRRLSPACPRFLTQKQSTYLSFIWGGGGGGQGGPWDFNPLKLNSAHYTHAPPKISSNMLLPPPWGFF